MILIITGAPRSGKTTLAKKLGLHLDMPVISTDDYLHFHHDRQPYEIAKKVALTGDCILEGTSAARLLRPKKDYFLAPAAVFVCRNDYAEIKMPGFDWTIRFAEEYEVINPGSVKELDLLGGRDETCNQGTIF